MKTGVNKKIGALLYSTALVTFGDGAMGQEGAEAIEMIVVTGRGFEENLQDVPISVTAFDEALIRDARIDKVQDFFDLTPGVTFRQAQNVGQSFVQIRGLTQVRNNEPPIAVVIDGALTASPNQLSRELFDIESIEVLRGPQGALYGRNATGGAIIITTKQPGNEIEAYGRGGYASGKEYFVQGGVSGPIIENMLYGSINAKYLDRGGYYDNITLGQKADPFEELSVLGKIIWEPTATFSADLRLNYITNDSTSLNVWFQPTILDDENKFAGFDFTGGSNSAIGPNSADRVFEPLVANNLGFSDRDIFEAVLKLEKQLPFGTITSITSHQQLEELFGSDQFPYTAATFSDLGVDGLDGTQNQYLDVSAWSEEIRIASFDDARFRWMFGGYLLLTDRFIGTSVSRDLGLGFTPVKRIPFPNDPDNPTVSFLGDDNDNTAWAVFANLTYDVTDRLEAYFGLRYDEERRKQTVSPSQFGLPPGVGQPGAVNERTFDALQPKATLRYWVSDNLSAFASWGRGFRSGQFNQNGVGDLVANANDFAREEINDTAELGFKSQWFDNRVTLNATGFYSDVKDTHYFLFIGSISAQVMVNIDKVELMGFDLEASANLAEGLDLYAGFALTDGEIKEYTFNPEAVGNKPPYISKTTLNLGAQYVTPVSSELEGLVRIDYSRTGERYWDPENTTKNSPVDLINARIALQDIDGRWILSVYGKNLLDTVWSPDVTADGGSLFTYLPQPRVYGFDVRYNF